MKTAIPPELPPDFRCPVCVDRVMERATLHHGLAIYICRDCGSTLSVPIKYAQ